MSSKVKLKNFELGELMNRLEMGTRKKPGNERTKTVVCMKKDFFAKNVIFKKKLKKTGKLPTVFYFK